MTVSELIEQLKKLPPDDGVIIGDGRILLMTNLTDGSTGKQVVRRWEPETYDQAMARLEHEIPEAQKVFEAAASFTREKSETWHRLCDLKQEKIRLERSRHE